MEHMRKINSLQPVRPLTEHELKVFLKFQHSVGRIIYFDVAKLDQHIILAPTHLIDAFKSIFTDRIFCEGNRLREDSWDLMSRNGVIGKRSIEDIWKKKNKKFLDHKEYLLAVMTHLDILVELNQYDGSKNRVAAEFYYVASMVRTTDETGYLRSPSFEHRNIAIAFIPSSSIIPPALSFRFISYCLSIFAVKKFGQKNNAMHKSAVFTIDPSLDMCVNCDDEVIVVRLVHSINRTLIKRDLASSIKECVSVALDKISQHYVQRGSSYVTNKTYFDQKMCCSSSDDPCMLSMLTLPKLEDSWICHEHGIEHTKAVLSSWNVQKVNNFQYDTACPVNDKEFFSQCPSNIHLRRLSIQYNIYETKELAICLGMQSTTWDDLYVTFGEEPERLKFEALRICISGSQKTFDDIRKAAAVIKIQSEHTLCKVVRGNLIEFYQEPEKWNLVVTDEHLDRVAPLIGNNSLAFLVEFEMAFQTWEQIKYRQRELDLVKLNRDILQEWKTEFCSLHSIKPTLRHIGQAFNDIGKNVKIIENVLADLF